MHFCNDELVAIEMFCGALAAAAPFLAPRLARVRAWFRKRLHSHR